MPDAVMLVAYPAVKPLNEKGYVTRLYGATDMVVVLVPDAVSTVTEWSCALWSATSAGASAAQDSGRVDVTAPAPTTVTTESASAAIRGV